MENDQSTGESTRGLRVLFWILVSLALVILLVGVLSSFNPVPEIIEAPLPRPYPDMTTMPIEPGAGF